MLSSSPFHILSFGFLYNRIVYVLLLDHMKFDNESDSEDEEETMLTRPLKKINAGNCFKPTDNVEISALISSLLEKI